MMPNLTKSIFERPRFQGCMTYSCSAGQLLHLLCRQVSGWATVRTPDFKAFDFFYRLSSLTKCLSFFLSRSLSLSLCVCVCVCLPVCVCVCASTVMMFVSLLSCQAVANPTTNSCYVAKLCIVHLLLFV